MVGIIKLLKGHRWLDVKRHSIPGGRRERERQAKRVPSISFFSNLLEGLNVLLYLMQQDEAALEKQTSSSAVRCKTYKSSLFQNLTRELLVNVTRSCPKNLIISSIMKNEACRMDFGVVICNNLISVI